jgi:outer membrane protein OmpA-like peptidoglycan-associated protein
MDSALPTSVTGAFGSNNPRSGGSGWWVTRTAGLSFSSDFTGNNGSGNANPGDTIALMLNDGTGNAGTVFNVIWQGAPSPTPTISTQPASTSKTVGDALTLSVTATRTGSGGLTYQWKKDGSALSGKTSATLSISSVTLGDAGSYTVDVTNTEAPYTPTTVTSSAAVVSVTAAAPPASSPSTPSSNSAAASAPATTTAGSSLNTKTASAGAIAFSAGASDMSDATKASLKATVKKAGKAATYVITGSAGKKSGVSDKATKALAKKRAQVMKAYLVKLGVSKSSITIKTKVVKPGKKPKVSVKALY